MFVGTNSYTLVNGNTTQIPAFWFELVSDTNSNQQTADLNLAETALLAPPALRGLRLV